jgi:hypothetical protein
MMDDATEIDTLKKELRNTQDSVLLIHSDLKQMSSGIGEMAASMKVMVQVQSDMRLMNERIETRHQAQKEINSLLHARIDATNSGIKDKSKILEEQASKGNSAYTFLMWVGGVIGTLIVGTAFTVFLWALKQG